MRTSMIILMMLISGCGPLVTQPTDLEHHRTPVDDRPTSSDVWRALANATERESISTSKQLARFVVVLARNGALSTEDSAAFDQAFGDITLRPDRLLTIDDVKRLRDLANKTTTNKGNK